MSDTPDLTAWIGRTETATDLITPRLLASFEAMLTAHLATGLAVPLGLHWCLSPPVAPAAQLGQDGHPVMGDFLPPVPYSRRMWAGGSLEHVSPFLPGDTVQKDDHSFERNRAWPCQYSPDKTVGSAILVVTPSTGGGSPAIRLRNTMPLRASNRASRSCAQPRSRPKSTEPKASCAICGTAPRAAVAQSRSQDHPVTENLCHPAFRVGGGECQ